MTGPAYMRVLAVDPSNLVDGGDPLAVFLGDGRPGRIDVLGAKQYEGGTSTSFSAVENDIALTFNRVGAHALVIEANSMGKRMAHAFEYEHHLPVVPINTTHGSASRGLSAKPKGTPKINRSTLNSMDKMEHTNWLVKMQNENDIVWPDPMESYGLRELWRQWSIFGEYHKDRLEAPPGDHDDLMMAMEVGTYWLRHVIVEGGMVTHVGGGVPKATDMIRPDYRRDSDVVAAFRANQW